MVELWFGVDVDVVGFWDASHFLFRLQADEVCLWLDRPQFMQFVYWSFGHSFPRWLVLPQVWHLVMSHFLCPGLRHVVQVMMGGFGV